MAIRWRVGIAAAALLCAALAIPHLIPQAEAQSPAVCDDCAAKKKALAFEEDFLKFLRGQLDNLQGRVKAVNDAIQGRKPPKATDDDAATLASWNRTIKELNKAIDDTSAIIQTLKAELAKCGTACPPIGTKPQVSGTTPVITPPQVPSTTPPSGSGRPGSPESAKPPDSTLTPSPAPANASLVPRGPQWPAASDCPECAALAAAAAAESAEFEKELQEAGGMDHAPFDLIERSLERGPSRKKFDACRMRCALRTPIPPEIPLVRHPPVVACPACAKEALDARDALVKLTYDELTYLRARAWALKDRGLLIGNADCCSTTGEYLKQFFEYLNSLELMSSFKDRIVQDLAEFDAAMDRLAKCNASPQCKESTAVAPGVQPIPGIADEEPKAECPECERAALSLKFSLALRRWIKAEIDQETAEKQAIYQRILDRINKDARAQFGTDDELASMEFLDFMLQLHRDSLARAEAEVAKNRAALDACNKEHPSKSCQPATGLVVPGGMNVLGGTSGAPETGGKGGIVIPGGMNVPGGTGGTYETGFKAGTGTQKPAPPPRGPETTPSGNAPPIGPPSPIGGVFAPTPSTVDFGFLSRHDDVEIEEQYFTFVVRGDDADLKNLLADPFFKDKKPHAIRAGPEGEVGIQVSIAAGAFPNVTWFRLVDLQNRGVINNLESVACWRFEDADPAAAGSAFVPVSSAWMLFGPPSPTPSFDPGELPDDKEPPKILRAGSDSTLNAPRTWLNGPVEIRVAKGCNEHTTTAIAEGPNRVPVAEETRQVVSGLRKP